MAEPQRAPGGFAREVRLLAELDKLHSRVRKQVRRLRKRADPDNPEVRDLIEQGEQLEGALDKVRKWDLPGGVDPVEYVTQLRRTAASFLEVAKVAPSATGRRSPTEPPAVRQPDESHTSAPRQVGAHLDLEAVEQRRSEVANELIRLRRDADPDDPDVPAFISSGELLETTLGALSSREFPEDMSHDDVADLADQWWPNSSKWLKAAQIAPLRSDVRREEKPEPSSSRLGLWIFLGLFLGVPVLLAIGATIVSLL